jgi:hypothetical protein
MSPYVLCIGVIRPVLFIGGGGGGFFALDGGGGGGIFFPFMAAVLPDPEGPLPFDVAGDAERSPYARSGLLLV